MKIRASIWFFMDVWCLSVKTRHFATRFIYKQEKGANKIRNIFSFVFLKVTRPFLIGESFLNSQNCITLFFDRHIFGKRPFSYSFLNSETVWRVQKKVMNAWKWEGNSTIFFFNALTNPQIYPFFSLSLPLFKSFSKPLLSCLWCQTLCMFDRFTVVFGNIIPYLFDHRFDSIRRIGTNLGPCKPRRIFVTTK